MTPPRRPPALLRAAAVVVAIFALIGFVAAAGAGGKGKGAADAGTAKDAGGSMGSVFGDSNYFPASKSPGGMHFRSGNENPSSGDLQLHPSEDPNDVGIGGIGAKDGGAKKPRKYFPASKSAGGFYPDEQEQAPAQQVQQR